jgi:hypothetical protein
LERIQKEEAVIAEFRTLFRGWTGGTKGNNGKPEVRIGGVGI